VSEATPSLTRAAGSDANNGGTPEMGWLDANEYLMLETVVPERVEEMQRPLTLPSPPRGRGVLKTLASAVRESLSLAPVGGEGRVRAWASLSRRHCETRLCRDVTLVPKRGNS